MDPDRNRLNDVVWIRAIQASENLGHAPLSDEVLMKARRLFDDERDGESWIRRFDRCVAEASECAMGDAIDRFNKRYPDFYKNFESKPPTPTVGFDRSPGD